MTTRTRRFGRARAAAISGLTVTVVATAAFLSGNVSAATPQDASGEETTRATTATRDLTPSFLLARQLPPHPSSAWSAGRVTAGAPEHAPFCFGEEIPDGENTRHREYWTEVDANAVQVTVVTPTPSAAKQLASRLNDAIRQCATRTEQEYPDVSAQWRGYGTVDVEEGARVQGVHTVTEWGASDIHLFSVGRDGRTVTIVRWGQMGDFTDAPVADFKRTTTIAVNRLY
ncbi:hypothetical protein ACTWP5_25580 [Streptomyces sp. 4N509B]|uniref:hypothetical protein n=1 Tax=Streptomyces sp. 4N509B TaxID=3457413 RepID=UPI003FCF9055